MLRLEKQVEVLISERAKDKRVSEERERQLRKVKKKTNVIRKRDVCWNSKWQNCNVSYCRPAICICNRKAGQPGVAPD